MANRWCDHGAYYPNTNNTPTTFGLPQEGDGLARAASTAAGTASVIFSAVPAGGSPNITVCGVSFTAALSSVTGAASADLSANALAGLINGSTTAVGGSINSVSSATTVSGSLPKLQNLVYARGPSAGAPAGTCQIMMRVGSAMLNYANNNGCCVLVSGLSNV